ncbi:hypothetical protein B0O99DRAFT_695109 [Bisporella sp. PMI_857]|nr:hypothetical protein B0O99DRAFT_695109 [Bisporella sp. PMI_857]
MESASYHRVPEEDQASLDSVTDEGTLIDATPASTFHQGCVGEDEDELAEGKIGFTALHFTVFFRLLAFIFHLVAVILLSSADVMSAAQQIFLYLGILRNSYVLLKYAFSACACVSVKLQRRGIDGGTDGVLLPPTIWGFSLVLDIILLWLLLPSTVIGYSVARGNWHSNNANEIKGFMFGIIGLPFFFFGAFDGGNPKDVALQVNFNFGRGKKDHKKRVAIVFGASGRGVETQLPETPVGERSQGENGIALV